VRDTVPAEDVAVAAAGISKDGIVIEGISKDGVAVDAVGTEVDTEIDAEAVAPDTAGRPAADGRAPVRAPVRAGSAWTASLLTASLRVDPGGAVVLGAVVLAAAVLAAVSPEAAPPEAAVLEATGSAAVTWLPPTAGRAPAGTAPVTGRPPLDVTGRRDELRRRRRTASVDRATSRSARPADQPRGTAPRSGRRFVLRRVGV